MDTSLFSSLVNALHSVAVLSFPKDQELPAAFSAKYCYHASLQACFAFDSLKKTVASLPERMIWEILDALGIRLLLFKSETHVFLLGPYVTKPFHEKQIMPVLMLHHFPAAYTPSLQLYYSAFPLVQDQELVHTIRALLAVLSPSDADFGFQNVITSDLETIQKSRPSRYQTRFDYKTIQRRYELENRFLQMIEDGETEHVLDAFDDMAIAQQNNSRYMNAAYSSPDVSMSIIRALSRKAAERGGAPLMEINEITQHSVQTSIGVISNRALMRSLHAMILELTQAVRRHKESEGKYSPPIQKVVSFLRMNFSQSLELDEIAKVAGFAPSYLSRQFKEEVGMTISETIRKLRCDQAARLLKETDLSVAEISAYVGYPDNNYFVKVFRKEYGAAPTEWRKQAFSSNS